MDAGDPCTDEHGRKGYMVAMGRDGALVCVAGDALRAAVKKIEARSADEVRGRTGEHEAIKE